MSDNLEVTPAEVDTVAEIKQLHDINLKALADDIAQVLSNHVGGSFDVNITKFERTNPGFPTNDRLVLNFIIEDESWMTRFDLSKRGALFGSTLGNDE